MSTARSAETGCLAVGVGRSPRLGRSGVRSSQPVCRDRSPSSGVSPCAPPPAIAFFLLASFASAQMTRNVPGQYPTIQSAINVCINGDNVLVAPGVYPGAINFFGKQINVHSSGGAAVTTITGTPSSAVVSFVTERGPALHARRIHDYGGNGGLVIQNASPVVQNCRIMNNVATNNGGGGVRCTTTGTGVASPTFTNCIDQQQPRGHRRKRRGLYVPMPVDRRFVSDSHQLRGVARTLFRVLRESRGRVLLQRCLRRGIGRLRDQRQHDTGLRGGMLSRQRDVCFLLTMPLHRQPVLPNGGAINTNSGMTLIGCLLAQNTSLQNGGAIYAQVPSVQTVTLKNCTVVDNSAAFVPGGVYANVPGGSTFSVQNSIIRGNTGINLEAPTATVTYSDVGFGYYPAGVGPSTSTRVSSTPRTAITTSPVPRRAATRELRYDRSPSDRPRRDAADRQHHRRHRR